MRIKPKNLPLRARHCWSVVGLWLMVAQGSVAFGGGAALDPLDPLVLPATMQAKPEQGFLITAANAGDRIVAAGALGVVIYSDDLGRHWHQADVPISVTITSLDFTGGQYGWAAGHSGTLMKTEDAGATWQRVLNGFELGDLPSAPAEAADTSADAGQSEPLPPPAIQPGDPLLSVHFIDATTGFAAGAFGVLLRTDDGGKSWIRWGQRLPNPDGNHLYAITSQGDSVLVAGERGSLFLSDDRGAHFRALDSGYEGTFFGAIMSDESRILAYGLRGNAYLSEDHGEHWTRVIEPSGNSLAGGTMMPDGRTVLVDQAGSLFIASAGSDQFQQHPSALPPLAALVPAGKDRVALAGVSGISIQTLKP